MNFLFFKIKKIHKNVIEKPLSVEAANQTRESVAKALYQGLFHWICSVINKKLLPSGAEIDEKDEDPAAYDDYSDSESDYDDEWDEDHRVKEKNKQSKNKKRELIFFFFLLLLLLLLIFQCCVCFNSKLSLPCLVVSLRFLLCVTVCC